MNKALKAAFAAALSLSAMHVAQAQEPATVAEVAAVSDAADFTSNHNGLTLNGAVGNPLFPTAQIPAQGSYRVQGSYVDLGEVRSVENDYDVTNNFGDAKFYGVHVAGRPWKTPLELSVGVEKLRASGRNVYDVGGFSDDVELDGLDRAGISLGAKYLFTRETDPLGVRIAAGAGFSQALAKNIYAYVVGTKGFNVGRRTITTHLGVRYDRFKFEGNIDERDGGTQLDIPFEDSSSKLSLYGGVEVPIDRRGRFSFIGEAGTRNSDFDFDLTPNLSGVTYENASAHLKGGFPYSLSLRYADNGWGITGGVMRQGLVDDSGVFFQIGKTF